MKKITFMLTIALYTLSPIFCNSKPNNSNQEAFPDGSYRKTCELIKCKNGILTCKCETGEPKRNGGWHTTPSKSDMKTKRTSIDITQCKPNTIKNNRGILECELK